jgi:hypothetical protein
MDEPGLNRLLVGLTSSDPDRIENALGTTSPTPTCLPLSRLRTGVLRENWKESERSHLASCSYCRKTEQQARSQVWHPSLVHLFWHARGLFENNDADVTHHLQHDACRRCLRLSSLLGADRILARLAGQIRAGVANAAHRLGKALASGIVANFALNTANARFAFEHGPHALVSTADPARLRLEVPATSDPPRLLRVLVGQGKGATEHLVIAHPGPQTAIHSAELLVASTSQPDPASLTVYEVDPSLLTREEVAPLRSAFLTAGKLDPQAASAWQAWAAQTLQRPELDSSLRTLLESLARPDTGKQCL